MTSEERTRFTITSAPPSATERTDTANDDHRKTERLDRWTLSVIAKYLLFTFIMNIVTIVITVIIINWNFRTPRTHRMPRWIRAVFLEVLPRAMMMTRPSHACRWYRTQRALCQAATSSDNLRQVRFEVGCVLPLQRQLLQIAAVRRVQRHIGLTHYFYFWHSGAHSGGQF